MALVTELPKTESDSMERISFTGISSDQYDDVPKLGEVFVMTVRCRVVSRTERQMASEGVRHVASVKVEDAVMGRAELPAISEQLTIDQATDDGAHADYGDDIPTSPHDNPFGDA